MAQDVNMVAVSGRLTRDPELRSTASGTAVLSFSLAVNDRRRDSRTGEWSDVANFFDVTLFGNSAEWLSRDLSKGKLVLVQGRLHQSTWERDGQRRSKVEVIADTIQYERPPREQQGQSGTYHSNAQNAPQTPPQAPTGTSQTYIDQRPLPPYGAEDSTIPF